MKTTLIKTNNSLILISDEEIKEGDNYCEISYSNEELIVILMSFDGKIGNPNKYTHYKKVLSQSPKLSKEVADEIGWIDVEELWEQFRIENPNTVGGFKEQYESFKWCFQKAQELNQKKYTEEDIRLIALRVWGNYESLQTPNDVAEFTNSNLQSLSQQWQVKAEEIDGVWTINKIIKT